MPGNARSGRSGTVSAGGANIEVLSWTLDVESEVFKYGSGGYKYAVAGVKDVKGSFEAVEPVPKAGTKVSMSLREGTGEDAGLTYSGEAIIKKVSVSVIPDTGDIIKYSVDFEGHGPWPAV